VARHRFAEQLHLARGGVHEAEQHAHEGRLARAVGTQEAEPDTGGNPQVHPGDGGEVAEPLDEATRDDHVGHPVIPTAGVRPALLRLPHRSR
jgi:hypothetical protein